MKHNSILPSLKSRRSDCLLRSSKKLGRAELTLFLTEIEDSRILYYHHVYPSSILQHKQILVYHPHVFISLRIEKSPSHHPRHICSSYRTILETFAVKLAFLVIVAIRRGQVPKCHSTNPKKWTGYRHPEERIG